MEPLSRSLRDPTRNTQVEKMALGQRAGRLGFEMKSESHTSPLFDRSRLAEKPGNNRRDTTGSRLQATERSSVSIPTDFSNSGSKNAMSPSPPFEDRRSMAPKPESDGSASASREAERAYRSGKPFARPDADTESLVDSRRRKIRVIHTNSLRHARERPLERTRHVERARHEKEKNIIGRTDRQPLRADSKTSPPGKKVCLHYTVSKDCSKPQDTRREKHLLAMVLSGDGSKGPPRTIAPVHRTAPAEKRDYRPLMALPRLRVRLSPPSRRKKPVIKFIRDKVA